MTRTIRALAPLAVALCATFSARTVMADCRDEAKKLVKGQQGPMRAFFLAQGKEEAIDVPDSSSCKGGEPCPRILYLRDGSEKPAPTLSLPAGYRLDDEYTDTNDWKLAKSSNACSKLEQIVAVLAPAPTACVDTSEVAKLLSDTESTPQALVTLRQKATARAACPGVRAGEAHGALADVVGETAQILGQIVVDRASSQAYAMIKKKIEGALHCEGPTIFAATCGVLRPLRIQDIASSRDALFGALVRDAYAHVTAGAPESAQVDVERTLSMVVLPAVYQPQMKVDPGKARAIVDEILATASKTQNAGEPKALLAVRLASIAFAKCELASPEDLAACPIGGFVDGLQGDAAAKPAARALAHELLAAVTLSQSRNQPDGRQRLVRAVDALFAVGCMLDKNDPAPELACADPDTVTRMATPRDVYALVRPLVGAALLRDSNATIAASVRALRAANRTSLEQDHERAFALLGGVLDYAATYGADTRGDAEAEKAAHEQRTRILESLTRDMTDRTGRERDVILSFGGSLRGVAGARWGASDRAFYGPLSLPIGIAIDGGHCIGSVGCHVELSAIDLGEYLAFDNTGTVRTPDVESALAPSVTLALGFGHSMPFILGLIAGYSPSFVMRPDSPDRRGSVNAGLVAGFYVPFFDAN